MDVSIEILYVCDDEKAVERLKSLGLDVEVSNFDAPTELLEAVGISLPDWLLRKDGNRLEVFVRTPVEKYQAVKAIGECVAISYRVEVRCNTEECVARAATVLARAGASVYRRGLVVYGFGEGDLEKIIWELTVSTAHPYS